MLPIVGNWLDRLRHPVRRVGSERYFLLLLVSFGATVILTRWFLALTGFPQIGGGELHIAHALWGGLFLFIASVLPLLWAGRTTYPVSAVLSGLGVGLFADEVGKFITAQNDYFYPAALPIIYAIFLIAALVYLRSRRPLARDPRSQLLAALDELEEAIERDLEPSERKVLEQRLSTVAEEARLEDHRRLAATLLGFVRSPKTDIMAERQGLLERLNRWWDARRDRLLGHRGAKWLYGATLTVIGARSVIAVGALVTGLVGVVVGSTSTTDALETAQLFVQGFTGALLVPGVVMVALGRTREGLRLASLSLVLALLVEDLIGFYLNQFDSIWSALFHLVLLVGLLAYQRGLQRPVAGSRVSGAASWPLPPADKPGDRAVL
jgi:hypothetical protein